MVMALVTLSIVLTACGGNSTASGGAGKVKDTSNKSVQKGNNWGSADDLQALLESDYGYVNDRELSNMDDKNDKTHREEINKEDGTLKHFVDISYDAKTNKITRISWYYDMNNSDIDYWMKTIGLVITNKDDQKIIRETLLQSDILTYKELELSDSSFRVNCYGDDDYRTLNVYFGRK